VPSGAVSSVIQYRLISYFEPIPSRPMPRILEAPIALYGIAQLWGELGMIAPMLFIKTGVSFRHECKARE